MLSVYVIIIIIVHCMVKSVRDICTVFILFVCFFVFRLTAAILYIFIHHIMVAQQKKIYNKKIEQLN